MAEGKPCPAGYTPYIYGFRNCQGQIEQEKLFLSNTPIVTESGVREAQVDLSMPHAINITLNTQASKTMKEATSAMKVGKDRIAIVVEGRVVNAPCVMAVISQSMIINSLHGEQDARPLVDVLNRHAAEQKTSPSSRQPDIDLRSSGQRPAGGARGGITPAELLFTIPIFSLKEERSMQRDMMPMAIPSGPEDVFPWFLARIIPFRTQE